MFNWFKKKPESTYDPTNITLENLELGFLVDYNDSTYQVIEKFEYEWEDDSKTSEVKLESASHSFYLEVISNNELYISSKISARAIKPSATEYIKQHDNAPQEIQFENTTYYKSDDNAGYCKEKRATEWDELLSYEFEDSTQSKFLTIDQWGEDEFEANTSESVSSQLFTQILPGSLT